MTARKMMYSILDIDLDYFTTADDPTAVLKEILDWGGRPVDFIVKKHSHVLPRWKRYLSNLKKDIPLHILHVDEHHDMMDERDVANIGNVMYQAMKIWPSCRIHWLVELAVDSPAMWLSDTTWKSFRRRFSYGKTIPDEWPRPNMVSVCTSPEFLPDALKDDLLKVIYRHEKYFYNRIKKNAGFDTFNELSSLPAPCKGKRARTPAARHISPMG